MSRRNLISQNQAAERLGVTARTIRNMISRGDLRGYIIRGVRAVRIDADELDALVTKIPTVASSRRKPVFRGNVTYIAEAVERPSERDEGVTVK